jgi:hypothetical protein
MPNHQRTARDHPKVVSAPRLRFTTSGCGERHNPAMGTLFGLFYYC